MRNRSFYCICFMLLLSQSFAQTTLEDLCKNSADNIYKQLKKLNISPGAKIAVLYFEGQSGNMNALQTNLGIRISQKIANYLSLKISKKEYSILFPVNTQERKYFNLPQTQAEESEFYTKLSENQRPDYFIIGKYNISADFTSITCTDMFIKENSFLLTNASLSQGFEPYTIRIINEEKEEFKSLSIPLTEEKDYFMELMRWRGNSDLFSFAVIDNQNKTIVSEDVPLHINKNYVIEVTVKEPCYLYAFMYSPEDKENPFLFPLFPLQEGKSELFQTGKHKLPSSAGFDLTPPATKLYIKIIAVAQQNIHLDMISISAKDGYIETKTSNKNVEIFLKRINNCYQNRIPVDAKLQIYNSKY